jgi:hypothetical protein
MVSLRNLSELASGCAQTFPPRRASLPAVRVFLPGKYGGSGASQKKIDRAALERNLPMKADRPLIVSLLLLATGLTLIFAYCTGTSGMNIAYPLSGSALHLDITTTGPAVLGGVILTAIGVLLLVWAFLAAIVCQISLLAGRDKSVDHIVERYREFDPESPRRGDTTIVAERKHTLL